MDQNTKKQLETKLEAMSPGDRKKLMRRASEMRDQAMSRLARRDEQRVRHNALDEDEDDFRPSLRKAVALQDVVLQLLMAEETALEQDLGYGPTCFGTVIETGSIIYRVQTAEGVLDCRVPTALMDLQGTTVAAGDDVEVRTTGDDRQIVAIHRRRSILSRPDPDKAHQEKVIVANVDAVAVVVSVVAPPLHPAIIDRFMVAIGRGGARPILVVNKMDLLPDSGWQRDEELGKLQPYRHSGAPIFQVSSETGAGVDEFRESLSGLMVAFVGHSGVGKSSLVNAVFPSARQIVGSLSTGYGRGAHTTTNSSVIDVGNGTRLIDTPGIRSFGLWQVTPEELARYFPEFGQLGSGCKFRDCTHTHEPSCGVKKAVESGTIDETRYDTYLRMFESLGG